MSKYFSRKCMCNSKHIHDSTGEAVRCDLLHSMLKAGKIQNLTIQPRFTLLESQKYGKDSLNKNERKVDYTADFEYYENGKHIVEDFKSEYTRKDRDYILRRKLFKYMYCDNDEIIFREVVGKN